MKRTTLFIISLLAIVSLTQSCINNEGIGGTGSVEGYVYKVLHPDGEFNFETDTVDGAEVRVYIQYGDEKPHGDDMRAGPDGYFKFKYLAKGTYTIFSYGEFPTGEKEVVTQTITIKNGETGHTNNLYLHSGKMYGRHQIEGQLQAKYYYSNNSGALTLRKDLIGASDERIYIRKKGSKHSFKNVRSGEDGSFVFDRIPTGEYEIYAFSEDPFSREKYILDEDNMLGIIEVTVNANDKSVVIETIYAKLRS